MKLSLKKSPGFLGGGIVESVPGQLSSSCEELPVSEAV